MAIITQYEPATLVVNVIGDVNIPFTFPFGDEWHLRVTANGAIVPVANYEVTASSFGDGGTVLVYAAFNDAQTKPTNYLVERITPNTQPDVYKDRAQISSETLEGSLDHAVMQIQEIVYNTGRDVDNALEVAQEALDTANTASAKADNAITIATGASNTAASAVAIANDATDAANAASAKADTATSIANVANSNAVNASNVAGTALDAANAAQSLAASNSTALAAEVQARIAGDNNLQSQVISFTSDTNSRFNTVEAAINDRMPQAPRDGFSYAGAGDQWVRISWEIGDPFVIDSYDFAVLAQRENYLPNAVWDIGNPYLTLNSTATIGSRDSVFVVDVDNYLVFISDTTPSVGSVTSVNGKTGDVVVDLVNFPNVQTALNGKAASSHIHTQTDVTGLSTTLDGKAAVSHTHAQADVSGLATALSGKAASSHTHSQADVSGLATALSGKAASIHTHAQADTTGLVDALADKAEAVHAHVQSDITGLTTALNGKAATSHTHTQANITGLVDTLADKASAAHVHAQADVTGLATSLAGKAATAHVHAQADVTGLVTSLADKANTTHTHNQTDVTGLAAALAGKQNQVTYGTTDLIAGTSALTTGNLYFVYE